MIVLMLVRFATFTPAIFAGQINPLPSAACSIQVEAPLTFAEQVRIRKDLLPFAKLAAPNIDAPHVLRKAFMLIAHAALPKAEWPTIDANLGAIGFRAQDWHNSWSDPEANARLCAGWGVLARARLRAEPSVAEVKSRQSAGGDALPIAVGRGEYARALGVLSFHSGLLSILEPGALDQAYRIIFDRIVAPSERSRVIDALDEIGFAPLDAKNARDRVQARRRFIAAWVLLLRQLKLAPTGKVFSSQTIEQMNQAFPKGTFNP